MKIVIALHNEKQPYWSFPEERVEDLRVEFPDLRILYVKTRQELLREIRDSEIAHLYNMTPEIFNAAKKLRWIHTPSAGVDQILIPEVIESDLTVTNSRGASSTTVAEHALGYMLALARKLIYARDYQKSRDWSTGAIWDSEPPLDELYRQTLGIIGYGAIGREVAKRAKAFDMFVIALRRNISQKGAHADLTLGPDGLPELLQQSDFVLLSLPLTATNKRIIGRNELRLMKPNAVLINISRGEVLDERALIEALADRTIAGAALDVFEEEPLPRENPLWNFPNVLITPHYAGLSTHLWDRLIALFIENIRRFLSGKELMNIVDKRSGY